MMIDQEFFLDAFSDVSYLHTPLDSRLVIIGPSSLKNIEPVSTLGSNF